MSLLLGPMQQHIPGRKSLTDHSDVKVLMPKERVFIPLFAGPVTKYDLLVSEGVQLHGISCAALHRGEDAHEQRGVKVGSCLCGGNIFAANPVDKLCFYRRLYVKSGVDYHYITFLIVRRQIRWLPKILRKGLSIRVRSKVR